MRMRHILSGLIYPFTDMRNRDFTIFNDISAKIIDDIRVRIDCQMTSTSAERIFYGGYVGKILSAREVSAVAVRSEGRTEQNM